MTPIEKIDNYWKIFCNINEWIRFSDQKSSILLAVYGVIISAIYSNSNEIYIVLKDNNIIMILVIIGSLIAFFSFCISLTSILPSIKKSTSNSVIYYGDISREYNDYGSYEAGLNAVMANSETYESHLVEQIYVNSAIATKKYRLYRNSLILFFLFFIDVVAIVCVYVIFL